ncbi:MAG: hypothetical protein J0I18_08015 [Actinobacteria bacterium]|nr:hypothetical protein [Actinomycetota bacterium]
MISSVLVVQASPAQADNYPSWNDVLAARATEAGKKAQVAAITALISGLKEKVKAAEDEAASRERDNERAQAAFTAGQDRATRLATNAASLQTQADASGKHAAAVAAKFVRTGSGNLTGTLLVSTTSNRAGLLYRLSVLGSSRRPSTSYIVRLHETATSRRLRVTRRTRQGTRSHRLPLLRSLLSPTRLKLSRA